MEKTRIYKVLNTTIFIEPHVDFYVETIRGDKVHIMAGPEFSEAIQNQAATYILISDTSGDVIDVKTSLTGWHGMQYNQESE